MYFKYERNCTNISDEKCIPSDWKQRYPREYLVTITVIYGILFLIGTVSNLVTCMVIYRIKFMHTATNYYLFNLSVSDVLVLLLRLPFDVYAMWWTSAFPNSFLLCFGNNLFAETCTYSSVLTVLAFTVERYLAICHPISCNSSNCHQSGNLKRALKVITAIWLLSIIFGSVMASQTGLIILHRLMAAGQSSVAVSNAVICQVLPGRSAVRYLFIISSLTFFVFPVFVISVLYVRIGLVIQRSAKVTRKGSNFSCKNFTDESVPQEKVSVNMARVRQSVLKMLVAVVIAFFICYAPFQANRMLGALVPPHVFEQNPWLEDLDKTVFAISGIFFYGSAIVNPIVYNVMSLKFRKAFKNTIIQLCCKSQFASHSSKKNYKPPRNQHLNKVQKHHHVSLQLMTSLQKEKEKNLAHSLISRAQPASPESTNEDFTNSQKNHLQFKGSMRYQDRSVSSNTSSKSKLRKSKGESEPSSKCRISFVNGFQRHETVEYNFFDYRNSRSKGSETGSSYQWKKTTLLTPNQTSKHSQRRYSYNI